MMDIQIGVHTMERFMDRLRAQNVDSVLHILNDFIDETYLYKDSFNTKIIIPSMGIALILSPHISFPDTWFTVTVLFNSDKIKGRTHKLLHKCTWFILRDNKKYRGLKTESSELTLHRSTSIYNSNINNKYNLNDKLSLIPSFIGKNVLIWDDNDICNYIILSSILKVNPHLKEQFNFNTENSSIFSVIR